MNFRSFSASLRNIIDAFFRGELLMRIGADKYFPHIAYTFMLFWVMILMDMMIENTLGKVEKNREVLTSLKIYHSQKVVELVSIDRVTTVERLLKDKGSAVGLPEKPAYRLGVKEK
ncbi:MAG: hypothetical protein SOY98_03965 [Candidatus Cryptobacteroides sp.]|nr:hypothetical protein [Bacteroidales bacterium]MDY3963443.1 hypothetical protein [Candidatus Cryptobacteroides sp.]